MSKILFGLVGIALISSCTRPGSLYNGGQRIANCVTSEPFEVPVQEGCATYVMYGQDTVAIVTQPMTIQIPKGMKVSTKGSTGDEISIEYEVLNDTDAKIAYNKSWQAIMFEDTRSGDYDYNDLIIHVRNLHSWNKLQIDIQPIALGSQKVIKLGCVIGNDKSKHIISEDVRKDLFGGERGFINTQSDLQPVCYSLECRLDHELEKGKDKYASIAWFIEVDDNRYFAINADAEYSDYDLLNEEGMPYGLVVYGLNGSHGTFAYAEEKISLFEAYPDFKSWINGEVVTFGKYADKKMIYKYNYEKIPGTTKRIWDWQ